MRDMTAPPVSEGAPTRVIDRRRVAAADEHVMQWPKVSDAGRMANVGARRQLEAEPDR
jgi:hypothetical protein